jgi:hypothetical protein
MIVISKVSNKKLLKGHRYEVQNLWNDGTNQRWVEGKVQLLGFGRYSVDSFTDSSGNPLSKTNYVSAIKPPERFIKYDDCKEGEILVCDSDHYKTLAKGSVAVKSIAQLSLQILFSCFQNISKFFLLTC